MRTKASERIIRGLQCEVNGMSGRSFSARLIDRIPRGTNREAPENAAIGRPFFCALLL
jgi:hypothetical protein